MKRRIYSATALRSNRNKARTMSSPGQSFFEQDDSPRPYKKHKASSNDEPVSGYPGPGGSRCPIDVDGVLLDHITPAPATNLPTAAVKDPRFPPATFAVLPDGKEYVLCRFPPCSFSRSEYDPIRSKLLPFHNPNFPAEDSPVVVYFSFAMTWEPVDVLRGKGLL